jgi:hypothetical protein
MALIAGSGAGRHLLYLKETETIYLNSSFEEARGVAPLVEN